MANYFSGYSPPQYQQQANVIVVPVQGEQGASMYPVAAGNTVLLMDFNLKKFWIKATDINGLPAKFAAFDFTEVKPINQGDTKNFISRDEFERWKNEIVENIKALVGGLKNVSASSADVQQSAVQATV